MPTYVCAYAYNVPCYVDFAIDAPTEAEAQRKAQQALKSNAFANVACTPDWNDPSDHRVFVMERAKGRKHLPDSLLQLTGYRCKPTA